jgi:hypothetical protein
MSTASDVQLLLLRELEGFERELQLFPDDESVWRTAPGVANSAGNLALHVAGNLQHFVGAVLGKTGYVRDREQEFGRRSGTRAELVGELHKAAAAVRTVLPALPPGWEAETYPKPPVADRQIPTGRFLLHLAVHAAFHLGQAGYLRRVLTGDVRSSGPLPLGPLGEPRPS